MKEARLITIISILLGILTTIISIILYNIYPNLLDYVGILTNIYCGIIVGLITSIVQYFVQKRRIINTIYGAYFSVYQTYYYAKHTPILFHYNSYSVYKKLIELNPKIMDALDEYHGFFRKYDKTYKKLNPILTFNSNHNIKSIFKSFIKLFNKKEFEKTTESYMLGIEKMLIDINKKRFEKDKQEMINIYNFLFNKK